jgi:hypothetical protein
LALPVCEEPHAYSPCERQVYALVRHYHLQIDEVARPVAVCDGVQLLRHLIG